MKKRFTYNDIQPGDLLVDTNTVAIVLITKRSFVDTEHRNRIENVWLWGSESIATEKVDASDTPDTRWKHVRPRTAGESRTKQVVV